MSGKNYLDTARSLTRLERSLTELAATFATAYWQLRRAAKECRRLSDVMYPQGEDQ